MLFFFVNRQASLSIVRFFRKIKSAPELAQFKIKTSFIWVFSFSILLLLISFQIELEILEIIAWNIFIICGIVYAVQGMGILLVFLNRPGVPRGLKFIINVFFIMMIFRVTVMMFCAAAMTVLGILETWLPLRQAKTNEPPSTPEV
jgi:uncharacterized protein YybS (DUF2232 family)